jgi:hypothetical protein
LRIASVQIAVTWPAANVAVPPGVIFAVPTVAVGTKLVPVGSVAVVSAGVVKPVAVIVAVGVSVAGTTGVGESTGRVGVSLAAGEARLGRAVSVSATAVLNNESDVAAESTVGPIGGVGVKIP